MKILVVDDNSENIDMMVILLKSEKYNVVSAGNAKEALKKLSSGKFDLIISDILMPVMDGFQFCRECKKDPELAKICFIFYTAIYFDDKDEEFALSLGAQKFIRKPQEPEVLLNLIKEVTKKYDSRKIIPIKYNEQDEKEVLKLYSERLVAKLKKKKFDLENEIASCKITESKLKESEVDLKKAQKVAHIGSWKWDIQSGKVECTDEMFRIFGIDKKTNIIDLNEVIEKAIHPDDLAKVEESNNSVKHNKTPVPLEYQIVLPDSSVRTVWAEAGELLLDEKGRPMVLTGFVQDITERKRAEKALQALNLRQEAILAAVPDIIMEVDIDKVYTWANKTGLEFFGEDVIGRKAQYYFEGEQNTYDKVQPIFIGDESIIYVESWQRRKDNQKRLLAWWCRVLKDENGRVTGALSTARDITGGKQAEDALRNSHEDLYRLLNSMAEGAYGVDVNGNCTFVNRAFLQILGYQNGHEVLGKHIHELMHHSHYDGSPYPSSECRMYRVHQTNQPINVSDEVFWSKDGVAIPVEYWSHPIVKDGIVIGSIATFIDITGRKLAEETIIKERSQLRTLIDNLPTGVFIKDKEYRKIIVNPVHVNEVTGHLKYLGLNSEIDILGKTDFEVFPKELAKKFFTDDQKVIRDGSVILNNEGLGYNEDGMQLWKLVSKIPLRDKNGEIIGMVGVTNDITERRQAEEALKISEEKFRTIFDNANDGMFLLDVEARKFVMGNTACSKMLGYSSDEFLKLDIAAIHPSEELPFILEQIEKILRGKEEIRSDIKFKRKDGTIFTADLSPTLVTIAEKRLVLIIFRDITERLLIETELRKAKEKAEESDKLKTAFLANISHEVRTPMNGIMGFLGLLKTPDLKSYIREQYYEIIEKSCNQLLDIITDIVEISKLDTKQIDIKNTHVNIPSIINTLHATFSRSLSANQNISIKAVIHSSIEECICITDESKLLQVLTNLIGNAIKFTPEGTIEIGCRLNNLNELEFFVKDTGIGIAKKFHELIFDSFRQVGIEFSQKSAGIGLGLSISKAYVKLLGGRIWLDSELGKGSTFYFTIPYIPVIKEVQPAEGPLELQNIDLSGKVLLIAEDDDTNYAYLEEILLNKKVKIIRAKNGKEAVDFCKTNPEIELVLMDIKMPVLNGYEATKQILNFRKNLPIVAHTAYAFFDDKQKALKCGCIDYISKPVNSVQLMAILNKHLKLQL